MIAHPDSVESSGIETSRNHVPRVVVATNMYPTTTDPGRGAFVKAQVAGLVKLGVPVELFEIRGDLGAGNYLRAISSLRKFSREVSAQLVYAFYGLTGWVASWQDLPVILSLAGDDVLGTPNGHGGITLKSRLAICMTHWAAWRASAVCVQSDEMKNRLWGKKLRRRTLVIPYGVDVRRFHPGGQNQARARLGLPSGRLIVIFPNTPTERRKRLDLALSAMRIVQREIPDSELRIVTKVSHDDMVDYYRAADCCLLTSDWEGSPNVVKEALLSGLPVVTTRVGDVDRWVPLSPESAICERAPEAIAEALVRVLKARRRVDTTPYESLLSTEAIAKQVIDVFRSVLDTNRHS